MSDSAFAAATIRNHHRRTVVVVGLVAVLALSVGVVVSLRTSGGSGDVADASATTVPSSPTIVDTCPRDVVAVLATIRTMPSDVQARLVAGLSPRLSDELGSLAVLVDPETLHAPADAMTLGQVLSRLSTDDRDLITQALPAERQQAAAESAQWAALSAVQVPGPRCP